MSNPSSAIDLGKLFQTVAGTLAQNRDTLNSSDTSNHNHGDNMVNTFELITRALQEKQGASASDQLAHAAGALGELKSGSAQAYARGLYQASQQFQGQQVTSDNAQDLIQALLGVGEAPSLRSSALMLSPANVSYVSGSTISFKWRPSPGASKYWLIVKRAKDGSPRVSKDMGNVLTSDEYGFGDDGTQYMWTVSTSDDPDSDKAPVYWTFINGAPPEPQQARQQPAQQQPAGGINDIIGTLIRNAQGKAGQQQQPGAGINDIIGTLIRNAQGQTGQPPPPGAGINDIIGTLIRNAQQPRQKSKAGGSGLDEIVNALVSNSAVGGSYRSQSGSLVANALISAMQGMVNRK